MLFSSLFIILIFAGIIPIMIGWAFNGAFWLFLFYNIGLVLLWIIDIVITPGKRSLEVLRMCDDRFSLSADNEVRIKVRNNSRYNLTMELRDEIPQFFHVKNGRVNLTAFKHNYCEGKYCLIPQKRGEFQFGNIHCRYKGVLKLCVKSYIFEESRKYKVYPNLRDLKKYNLHANSKMRFLDGTQRERIYTIGTEFESLREYSEGDDYRKINWLATARVNKLIVNNYEPERNQQIFILTDCSRIMNSEINGIKKLDYAINSAFVLADATIKKGDNIGLAVFDDKVRCFIKPGKGPEQFKLIAESLYDIEENFVTADYAGVLTYLNLNHRRRSLLCIFTEIFNTAEAIAMASILKNSAKRHIPLIITIRDERLYETAGMDIENSEDVFLKSASIKLVKEREKALKIFRNSGIACVDTAPDKLSIKVINKYLEMKAKLLV